MRRRPKEQDDCKHDWKQLWSRIDGGSSGEHREAAGKPADDDVPDKPETLALHDQAGEPAGHRADDKPNNEINEHAPLPSICRVRFPAAGQC